MSKSTGIKIQTLSKAEYILAKHIPNSNPAKKSLPDEDKDSSLIPTPKPLQAVVQQRNFDDNIEAIEEPIAEHKKKAGNDPLKRALEEIKLLKDANNELAHERDELAAAYERIASQSPLRRDLEKRNEGLLAERNYFENELKRSKANILDLENEIRRRDEVLRNSPEYENQITKLQKDILELKKQRDFDINQYTQTIARLQDENNYLANDNVALRNSKKALEDRLDALKQDLLKMDDVARNKMGDVDAVSRALDQEKKNNEALRQLLQMKTDDIIKKETEKSNLLAEIAEIKAKSTGSNETELRQVLLMIEVERLQRMLAQKNGEQLTPSDKIILETELGSLRNKIPDYERRNQVLSDQLSKALKDLDDWKKRGTDEQVYSFENGEESLKKAGNGAGSPDKATLDSKLRTMKLKVLEYENKIILFMIEIERLGNILGELQQENEFWRGTVQDLQNNQGLKDQEVEDLKVKVIQSERAAQLARDSAELELRDQYEEQIRKIRVEANNALSQAQVFKLDNEKLARALEEKRTENEGLKNKIVLNQHEHEQNLVGLKNQFENTLKTRLDFEVQQVNENFRPVRENYETQIAILKRDNENLQNKLVLLTGEIERLSDMNSQAKDEIIAWKKKLQETDYENEKERKRLENDLRLTHEQHLLGEIKKFQNDINGLEEQNWKLKVKDQDLEIRLILFMIEIERLHGVIVEKEKENEFWKEQLSEERLENERQINELKKQFEALLIERLETERNEANAKFRVEKSILDSEINELKLRISKQDETNQILNQDNQRLTSIVTDKGAQIEALRQQAVQKQIQFNAEAENIKLQTESTVRNEYENKIRDINQKFLNDQRALEDIIRQLRAKNNELEGDNGKLTQELIRLQDADTKVVLLSQEITRLSDILIEKAKENEALRGQYGDLERASQAQLEDLRIKNKADLESLVRDINAKFQQERNEYEKQIRALQQKIIDLENKIALLSGELERLNSEIDQWKNRSAAQEQQRVRDLETQKQQLDLEKKMDIERELVLANSKAQNEKQTLEAKIKELKQKIMDMENKLTFAAVEIERLNTNYDDAKKEIEEWKQKCAELELSRANDLEEMKNQMNAIRRSSISTSDKEIRFMAEKAAFEGEIMQNRQKIEELTARVESLQRENQKLSALASDRKREIDQLKLKFGDTGLEEQLEALRKENEDLKRNGLNSNENRTKTELERQRYENEINQLKQTIQADKLEQNKLYELINQRKSENDELSRQLKESRDEVKKTHQAQKQAEIDLAALADKYDDLSRENEQADLYKNQLEKNNLEFAEKNKDLLQKIQEVDALKVKYEDAIQNINVEPLQNNKKMKTLRIKLKNTIDSRTRKYLFSLLAKVSAVANI